VHASTLAHRPRVLEALAACSMAPSGSCPGALLNCSDSCGSFGDRIEGVCVCVWCVDQQLVSAFVCGQQSSLNLIKVPYVRVHGRHAKSRI